MIKVAILASGSGSNAENIINYFSGNNNINIGLIISNRKDAYVHERAKKLKIESFYLSNDKFKTGDAILSFLLEKQIDFIVLAGFLLKIPENIVEAYPNKIINIHPALLPKFGGKGMYGNNVHKAVLDSKEKESGITIHYVNKNYDEGNIIFQEKCLITENDSVQDIAEKVHILEYKHFPKIIEEVVISTFQP